MSENIKRKIILINKDFQIRFSLMLLIPIAIIQIIFWIVIELFFYKMIEFGKEHQLPAGHNFYKLLLLQKKEFAIILLASSIIVAIIMFIWGIYMSHRIAGPLYKLEKHLNEIKDINELKLKKLSFRKKDFFQTIPETFNRFIGRM